ncbi:3-phosphoshikimate 1-carboxyvinyltransferase [Imtechella halotolerans]|uniref:3-phosphoshikimate 1-carboxyvinyltransferase n=1 Tax=Imtechella halotolerans K1 TaxID=946077 RepID=I0WKK0_9FLAO|nr:3-phosphoshikimate 1-carboxyvinyltransferase [Imtechella halotolerans]EID76916.1 3-phosphoshikimate 1-carboxyvinyltransferase [Imtechella halotolerans K1]WMQ62524.1 3-phosphoshikimate 1-carboxyvinyltransferase [Imtechella halotolerans]
MKLHLFSQNTHIQQSITITGSKSESNRLLLLQALFPQLSIENVSNSDDACVMDEGLSIKEGVVDIHHAGTAMRFLTAFFAMQEGRSVILTGSKRMKERPIGILVDALRQLGADISFTQDEGYPPLQIEGRRLDESRVVMAANVSSQYISALLLIASRLPNGLELILEGDITSVPYIEMTLSLLNEIGVDTSFNGNIIRVMPLMNEPESKKLVVESDWSSASYFYSIVSICQLGTQVRLSSYKSNSLQGDSVLASIYQQFGVTTEFEDNQVVLTKTSEKLQLHFEYDLTHAPDIAQTIAVSCFALGIGCSLSGLHTLKIKETDRLEALKVELSKLGAQIDVTNSELFLKPSLTIKSEVTIDTYNDHRMAMAFAPLALKVPLYINDAEVVSKSYPDFWRDMEQIGFLISEQ